MVCGQNLHTFLTIEDYCFEDMMGHGEGHDELVNYCHNEYSIELFSEENNSNNQEIHYSKGSF